MGIKISKLQTSEMQWMANMTEQNHLGKALLIKPDRLMGVVDRLFSAQNIYSDNPLTSLLIGSKLTDEQVDGTSWDWELKGADSRPLVSLGELNPADTTKGKYLQPFTIRLDENWFLEGDVIKPSNNSIQVRVMENPVQDGDGWKYTVRLMSDDKNAFMPSKYLQAGEKWTKLFSVYAEAAQRGGSTVFSTPINFTNHLGKLRKEYKITDYASTTVLKTRLTASDGRQYDTWIRYAEVEFFRQWNAELERAMWLSRSTDTVFDGNGRPIRSFPGIREQLEDSHVHYYTHLTSKLLEEFIMDVMYGKLSPGHRRTIKGYTGTYGMMMFSRAIEDGMAKGNFVKNIEPFINKTSGVHPNSLEAGYQFVRYHMANGCSLELVYNPLYDDREINSEVDPITGYPIESQRITFLDFSGDTGNNTNIKRIKKRNGDVFTYVSGMYGPYGPANKNSNPAHAGDYYEMHIETNLGAQITDVTKCGELILARN